MNVYDARIVSLGRSPDLPLPPGLVPTACAERSNALCGDDIALDVVLENGTIRAVGYRVTGCAFVRASAALLAEQSEGLTRAQARALASQLADALRSLGRLPAGFAALNGVHLLPARRRCALLPWDAFAACLEPCAV